MLTDSKPKSVLRNAVWSMILSVWTSAVLLFLAPFLIAHLGDDRYGLLILLMSVTGIMGIMDLGLGEATLRYVAYYYGRRDLVGINRVVGATLSVYIATSFLGMIVLCLGAPWIVTLLAIVPEDQTLVVTLLRWTAVIFASELIGGAFGSIPMALQRFDIRTKVMIARSIFQLSGIVVISLLGFGIYHLVLWNVATSLFTQTINLIMAKHLIPRICISPSFMLQGIREVFSYGVFSLISKILGSIWSYADRFLLGALISTGAVTYLTVPYTVVFKLLGVVMQAGLVLFPKLSATSSFDSKTRIYLTSTWAMLRLTIIVFVPLTVLMPDFLRLWISAEFAKKSAFIGQIIAASCMIRGAYIAYESLFKGIGKPKYLTQLVLVTSLTSLGANLILIPKYGLAGAGWCYTITPLWGLVTIFLTWKYILKKEKLTPLLKLIVLPMLLGFLCLGICLRLRRLFGPGVGWKGFIGLGVLFVFLTVIIMTIGDLLLSRKTNEFKFFLRYVRQRTFF